MLHGKHSRVRVRSSGASGGPALAAGMRMMGGPVALRLATRARDRRPLEEASPSVLTQPSRSTCHPEPAMTARLRSVPSGVAALIYLSDATPEQDAALWRGRGIAPPNRAGPPAAPGAAGGANRGGDGPAASRAGRGAGGASL